jgi:hypothetical protein
MNSKRGHEEFVFIIAFIAHDWISSWSVICLQSKTKTKIGSGSDGRSNEVGFYLQIPKSLFRGRIQAHFERGL